MNNLQSSASAPHSQKRRTQRPPEPPLSVHDRRPLRPLRLAPLQPFSLPTRSMLRRRQLSSKSQKETLSKQRDQVLKNRRSQRPSQSSVPPPQTLRIPFQSLSAPIRNNQERPAFHSNPFSTPLSLPSPLQLRQLAHHDPTRTLRPKVRCKRRCRWRGKGVAVEARGFCAPG